MALMAFDSCDFVVLTPRAKLMLLRQLSTTGILRYVSSRLTSLPRQNMSGTATPSVYVTRRVPPRGMEILKKANVSITQWDSDAAIPREELIKNVAGKDALFCLLTDKIDAAVLDAAGPQLKVVGTMSVGYEHVDLGECNKRGIPVGFTPDVLTTAVAELTLSLLLAVSRRVVEGAAAVKSGEWSTWSPLWMCGRDLHNSTVGIVGMGRIGVAVARRLVPFGVSQILYTNEGPSPGADELSAIHVETDELLEKSDFVLALCSLNESTKGMFNKEVFKKMKSTAIFVNTSRGGVVNQDDLYDALKSGEISAAGLDVTVPEPLPTDDKLLSLPNCVVLPHIASATMETRNTMSALTANNILAALKGEPMPAKVAV